MRARAAGCCGELCAWGAAAGARLVPVLLLSPVQACTGPCCSTFFFSSAQTLARFWVVCLGFPPFGTMVAVFAVWVLLPTVIPKSSWGKMLLGT